MTNIKIQDLENQHYNKEPKQDEAGVIKAPLAP